MQNYDTKSTNKFGDIYYYLNGRIHRTDGPAIDRANGSKEYWINGKRHRVGKPAVTIIEVNRCRYYINGELHRIDGPAIHDLDNPENGKYFFIEGKEIDVKTTEEFLRYVKLRVFA